METSEIPNTKPSDDSSSSSQQPSTDGPHQTNNHPAQSSSTHAMLAAFASEAIADPVSESHDEQKSSGSFEIFDESEAGPTRVQRFLSLSMNRPPSLGNSDLLRALHRLAEVDTNDTYNQIDEFNAKLSRIRQHISQLSRTNFILERELTDIDEKIKLLIQNRISAQEVVASSASLNVQKLKPFPLQESRALYEYLLHLLQTQPRYLSLLIRLVDAKQTPSLVQTIICDLLGDQYDNKQERTLLQIVQAVLKVEFDECTDMGSYLRNNTCITQMLTAYARRGTGLMILKNTLLQPLQLVLSQKQLNLEINPMKVYQEYVIEYEMKEGKKCPLPACETADEASKLSEVKAIVEPRLQQLLQFCELFLNRIVDSVESIPYGMRWICQQLVLLGGRRFPEADRTKLLSLVGGYIYLRFFNPVVVTPDAVNFVRDKLDKVMRRNLILIAKVLQTLSNGILFGEKEEYMTWCNPFIEKNRSKMFDYFYMLTQVEPLETSLPVDESVIPHPIHISLNQIFVVHSLCAKHLSEIAPDSTDPLRAVVKMLGLNAPEEVKTAENITVSLKIGEPLVNKAPASKSVNALNDMSNPLFSNGNPLFSTSSSSDASISPSTSLPVSPRGAALSPRSATASSSSSSSSSNNTSSASSSNVSSSNANAAGVVPFASYTISTQQRARRLLRDICQAIDELTKGDVELRRALEHHPTLLEYLAGAHTLASILGYTPLSKQIDELNQLLKYLLETPQTENLDAECTKFAIEAGEEYSRRVEWLAAVSKRLTMVQDAEQTIQSHHDSLQAKLDLYKTYLGNARHGAASSTSTASSGSSSSSSSSSSFFSSSSASAAASSSSSSSSSTRRNMEPLRIKHKELAALGMIASVDSEVDKDDLKNISYIFTPMDDGRFKVEAFYTKLISISVLSEPIYLNMEDLLQMQRQREMRFQMERVWLEVNLLIHFLNTRFIAPVKS